MIKPFAPLLCQQSFFHCPTQGGLMENQNNPVQSHKPHFTARLARLLVSRAQSLQKNNSGFVHHTIEHRSETIQSGVLHSYLPVRTHTSIYDFLNDEVLVLEGFNPRTHTSRY